ncbi:MAG: hypothetical protein ACKPKO_41955, partial [Candidatus Fonsibacter sp.]
MALIKRKSNIGKIYYDKDNLLKQVALNQQDDLFIDDEPPQPEEVLAEPPQPQATPVEPPQEQEEPTPPVPEPPAAAHKRTTPTRGLRSGNGRRGSTMRRCESFKSSRSGS